MFCKQFGILCFLVICIVNMSSGTRLMRRIRERKNIEVNKGLDLQSQDLVRISQPIQDVLMSIDDKLRSLDTFSYTLKLARLDFSLDQLVKRMENIETKFSRLDTKFDVKMEKMEEIVISKDIKEEFSNEYLSRRLESLNEKINNKAAYLDAKLDMKLEKISNKLEFVERELQNSADDILERVVRNDERFAIFETEMLKKENKFEELDQNINNLQGYIRNDFTNFLKITSADLSAQVDELQDSMQTMYNDTNEKLKVIQMKLNQGVLPEFKREISNLTITNTARNLRTSICGDVALTQISNLTSNFELSLQSNEEKLKKLDSDLQIYSKKAVSGIQDLWQTTDKLKIDITSSLEQANKTRDILNQEFRLLQKQIEFFPRIEPKMKRMAEDLDKKMSVLTTTVDNNFATLLLSQNSFISSCHRIQDEETHVYKILQQIVYEMRNRSVEETRRIEHELHQQSFQMNESLIQITNTVLETGNLTSNVLRSIIRQRENCMLRTNDVTCKLMESLCNTAVLGLEKSNDNLIEREDFQEEAIKLENLPKRNFGKDDLDHKNYDFLDYSMDNESDYSD